MTLSLSDATAWLVANGYAKVDGRLDKYGRHIYRGCRERYWTLTDYPEEGCSFLGITPESKPIKGDDCGTYGDMSVQLKIEGGLVVGAAVGESYSGGVIACAKEPPTTTERLQALMDVGREVFRQMVLAMSNGEGPARCDDEIKAEVGEYLANNPEALELFVAPDEEDQP